MIYTLTGAQEAAIAALGGTTHEVDGFEDEGVRVHATFADGTRHGYVFDAEGELVAATPISADGEPIDA
jgi:hypothetical protein